MNVSIMIFRPLRQPIFFSCLPGEARLTGSSQQTLSGDAWVELQFWVFLND